MTRRVVLGVEMREIVGIHACKEALRVSQSSALELSLKEGWKSSHELRALADQAEKLNIPVKSVGLKRLNKLGPSHQGVALKLRSRPQWEPSQLADEGRQIIVILDEISDPQNLGAIMRTSWLMGAKALFISERRSAQVTAAVAKVACGAAEHLPVVVEKNFAGLFEQLKHHGFWVYGLAGQAQSDLWDIELPEKVAWVVGSEAKGLRVTTERICDQLVAIPQAEAAASYNASVATAMALSETQRQWKNP